MTPRPSLRRHTEGAHKWTRKGVLVPVITAVLASIVLAVAPSLRQPSPWESAMKLVFAVPLRDFVTAANDPKHDDRLDWTTDNCSAPVLGSAGKTYDFTDPCRRHDFAYRNLARLDGGKRWTAELRARVDGRFLADMRDHCASRPTIQRSACRAWATLYYDAVRKFSGP